jgi:hypothetical protein
MDLSQVRGFFDAKVFDAYSFQFASWSLAAFSGQFDLANPKVSLMDKGTRRRMMYVSPGQEPPSSVIRESATQQVFLVGQQSKDTFKGAYLRDVISLHLIRNTAQLWRKAPTGPSNNPGWATNTQIETTFADYEFRSDNENQIDQINQWGVYNVSLPFDSSVRMHDTLVIDGRTFYLFDIFFDSGMRGVRGTDRPDDRVDFVYTTVGASDYDPSTLKPTSATVNYNVTGEITPYDIQQDNSTVVNRDRLRVMILKAWIGVTPKLNDTITFDSKTYRITRVAMNKLHDEWHLVAEV